MLRKINLSEEAAEKAKQEISEGIMKYLDKCKQENSIDLIDELRSSCKTLIMR